MGHLVAVGPADCGPGMKPLMVVLFVDALGWRLCEAHPGFAAGLSHRRQIATILGFSSGALPTAFTGQMPHEHGRFLMYRRAAGPSVFAGFERLGWLPTRIRRSWRLTRLLTRLVEQRGVRGYFNLYEVPRDRLASFDLPERDDIFLPGGLPVDSIWDSLERRGLAWQGWNWRTSEREAFDALLASVNEGGDDVLFLYTAELDATLNDLRFFPIQERRGNFNGVIQAERQGGGHGREELRARVGKWIAGQRPQRHAMRAGPGGDHRGFREQPEIAAREVAVFIRRVVRRRHAANRPVIGRVNIAHRELDP